MTYLRYLQKRKKPWWMIFPYVTIYASFGVRMLDQRYIRTRAWERAFARNGPQLYTKAQYALTTQYNDTVTLEFMRRTDWLVLTYIERAICF